MALENFREVTTGLRFPEGPVWMPDRTVILVEIEGRRLTRVHPDGRKETIATLGGGPNGAAIGPDGMVYVTNHGGSAWTEDAVDGLKPVGQPDDYVGGSVQRVDPKTGAFETLYTHCGDRQLRGPNDLVFDQAGGFYFTDLGKARHLDVDRGAVYYARTDGSLIKEIAGPTLFANGIALSPDNKTLYFVEGDSARLWAMDIKGPGEVERLIWPSPNGARFLYQSGAPYQRFDSMAVDAAGNICIASLIRGGIHVVSPQGTLVEHVPLPDRWTTNICFGGADLRTAFVTCSQWGKLVSFTWPRPGLKLNWQ